MGLDFRPHRPGERLVYRLYAKGSGHLGLAADHPPSNPVHPVVQRRLLCLGRDLLDFPSITANLFGRKWATTNYGVVYTSKGAAAVFAAPVAAYIMFKAGSWVPIFYVAVACDVIAALMAIFLLKPMAKRTIAHEDLVEQRAEAARKLTPA